MKGKVAVTYSCYIQLQDEILLLSSCFPVVYFSSLYAGPTTVLGGLRLYY